MCLKPEQIVKSNKLIKNNNSGGPILTKTTNSKSRQWIKLESIQYKIQKKMKLTLVK